MLKRVFLTAIICYLVAPVMTLLVMRILSYFWVNLGLDLLGVAKFLPILILAFSPFLSVVFCCSLFVGYGIFILGVGVRLASLPVIPVLLGAVVGASLGPYITHFNEALSGAPQKMDDDMKFFIIAGAVVGGSLGFLIAKIWQKTEKESK